MSFCLPSSLTHSQSQQEGTRERPDGEGQTDRVPHPKSPDSRTGGSPGTRGRGRATVIVPPSLPHFGLASVIWIGCAPRDARGGDAAREPGVLRGCRPGQYVCLPTLPRTPSLIPLRLRCAEALHAQISETLRGILSDDEYAAEAPG